MIIFHFQNKLCFSEEEPPIIRVVAISVYTTSLLLSCLLKPWVGTDVHEHGCPGCPFIMAWKNNCWFIRSYLLLLLLFFFLLDIYLSKRLNKEENVSVILSQWSATSLTNFYLQFAGEWNNTTPFHSVVCCLNLYFPLYHDKYCYTVKHGPHIRTHDFGVQTDLVLIYGLLSEKSAWRFFFVAEIIHITCY